MSDSVNLCSFQINNFNPHYSDIKPDSMIYANQKTAAQYFSEFISLVSNPHPITENLTISDLEAIVDQASLLLQNGQNLEAKLLIKGLPHLFSYINFESTDTDKLFQSLNQLSYEYPNKSFIKYPLLILSILREKFTSGYNFLFYHLLSIPKFLLRPALSVFLSDKSSFIYKCFVLSTFIPSFEFDIPMLSRPIDHFLLPDPLQIIDHINEFTDEQIGYACHVMQLCHHYLLSIIHAEDLKIENFTLLLYLIGSSSFSKSCFSLALFITSQIPSENSYVVQFIQKVHEFGGVSLIEELFLYNTSESFSYLIPISSNIFYQFFVENSDRFTSEMKNLIISFSIDLRESANYLNELSNNTGNRAYLYWLYIFLTRLTSKQENDEVKIEIIREFWTIIQHHIQKVYLLIGSAEKFKDPSIDLLLSSTLYSIFKYIFVIVQRGNISDSFVNQVYDFITKSLHFIISTPVIVNKVTSIACQLLKTYRCIQQLLNKQPLFFKRCLLTFTDTDYVQSPVIALAMSNIHVPISFISKLANLLILSEEPTCFYCLSSLINSCQKLNEMPIFLIQFFHNLVFLKSHRETQLQQKVLSRYFLLACSLIINNSKFAITFVNCNHFDAFDNLFRRIVHESLAFKETFELQESIIFFLWSLFRSFIDLDGNNDDEFKFFEPYQIESFLKNIEHYTKNGATILLEAIIDFLTLFKFQNTPSTNHLNNIKRSRAANIKWFMETIMNLKTIDLAHLPRPNLKIVFTLPWKQNCIYSDLLNSSNWGVEFKKITKNNT